jgi:hypothetical protein
MYKYLSPESNKSILNWTPVCRLLCYSSLNLIAQNWWQWCDRCPVPRRCTTLSSTQASLKRKEKTFGNATLSNATLSSTKVHRYSKRSKKLPTQTWPTSNLSTFQTPWWCTTISRGPLTCLYFMLMNESKDMTTGWSLIKRVEITTYITTWDDKRKVQELASTLQGLA